MPLESNVSMDPPSLAAGRPTDLPIAFGGEVGFRTWYEASLPRVYAYIFHRCGRDPDLAEELTQQAFVEVVRSRTHFAGRSASVTWVISIARNKLVDHRKAARDRGRLDALRARELLGASQHGRGQAARDEIDEALEMIPGFQRVVLILHYMDGLTVRDVSLAIGKSEAATASLLARGREAFRDAYERVNK
jgi:RNA polymerase sigma-70 factor (ECF subfamily)